MVAKFFMDGIFLGELSQPLPNLNAEPNPITFGNTAGNNFGFFGCLFDIKLWSEQDKVLSEADIDSIGLSTNISYQDSTSLRSSYWYLFKELGSADFVDVYGNPTVVSHESIPIDSNNPEVIPYKKVPAIPGSEFDVLGNRLDHEGYVNSGILNPGCDFTFPDMPSIPLSLRGQTFTYDQLMAEVVTNDLLEMAGDGSIYVLSSAMSAKHKQRIAA